MGLSQKQQEDCLMQLYILLIRDWYGLSS